MTMQAGKTVTIPSYKNPFDVEINGVKYSYKAGATVSVPDEVAALIEANAKNAPQENDPTVRLVTEIGENPTDKEVASAKATAEAIEEKGLPEVTAEDNGKVLGVSGGTWTKITPESGAIPTITIDPSQIISAEGYSVVIQLTAEQGDIFKSDAPVINMDIGQPVMLPVMLFMSYTIVPDLIVRSSIPTESTGYEIFYTSAKIDSDDKCYIDMLETPDAGRYNLSYRLRDQSFVGTRGRVYELVDEFVNSYKYRMPQLRVDENLSGAVNYTLAFHCSSITPITDGYHCVFIHDEYDAQASKMSYTVFSFDIDSSYNITNKSYTTHYAV